MVDVLSSVGSDRQDACMMTSREIENLDANGCNLVYLYPNNAIY
jgi:hypothetical protein